MTNTVYEFAVFFLTLSLLFMALCHTRTEGNRHFTLYVCEMLVNWENFHVFGTILLTEFEYDTVTRYKDVELCDSSFKSPLPFAGPEYVGLPYKYRRYFMCQK
jgi:hypothetical protein